MLATVIAIRQTRRGNLNRYKTLCLHMTKISQKIIPLILILAALGCQVEKETAGNMYKKYNVPKAKEPVELDGNWQGGPWRDVEPCDVKHWMGDEPEHKPKTQAKLLYDDKYIYVMFRVEDKYVRAVAQNYHDPVYFDSCVEFFFSPGEDASIGYFNIEINCGGVMLVRHTIVAGDGVTKTSTKFPNADCDRIEIYHSEPKIVEPEKQEPTTWIIEYKVPFDLLEKYCQVSRPAPGVKWRANFYKCADMTSQPHWLTWSVVDYPTPNFHLPQYFGTLLFR